MTEPEGDWRELVRDVQRLDPLRIDDLVVDAAHGGLLSLPRGVLTEQLDRALESVLDLTESQPAGHAALRDVGFLASALRQVTPGRVLSPSSPHHLALAHLGRLLDQRPRETVVHYAAMNPLPPRRRTFTGSSEEELLIRNLSASTEAVVTAARFALAASSCNDIPKSVVALDAAERTLRDLVSSTSAAGRDLSTSLFVDTLRPLWEPLRVGADDIDGAGPVQLPLYLIDAAVWADGTAVTEEYTDYASHNASYGLAVWRESFDALRDAPSVLTILEAKTEGAERALGTGACVRVLEQLVRFRRRHAGVASRFYRHRLALQPGAVGSSGYASTVVQLPLDLTEAALARARALLPSVR